VAYIRHKLEILVDIDNPITEINGVIDAYLRLHPGQEYEILTQLQRDITAGIAHYEKLKGGGNDEQRGIIGSTTATNACGNES